MDRPPSVSLAEEEIDALSDLFDPDKSSETNTKPAENTPRDDKALDALRELADDEAYTVEKQQTKSFLTDELGIDPDAGKALASRIESHQEEQKTLLDEYATAARHKRPSSNCCLTILNGWDSSQEQESGSSATTAEQILQHKGRSTTGGIFLRWNGYGVAINPGQGFLQKFHDEGFHITDIDSVIITRDTPASYADLEAIYALNYRLNAHEGQDKLHIIHYYLNAQAHRDISARLKPNFKQERGSVHGLELFIDSPDVERVSLTDSLDLHYFQASNHAQGRQTGKTTLGIKLDCLSSDGTKVSSVGYLSGTSWSPTLASHLGSLDLLITGLETTSSSDYTKVKYNEDSLGYFGSYSLMEELTPKIQLIAEFNGVEGDIRIETAKKMRQEYAYSNQSRTVVLPADTGLQIDLQSLQVRCSVTSKKTEPAQIRVTRTRNCFGRLHYLSPSCVV